MQYYAVSFLKNVVYSVFARDYHGALLFYVPGNLPMWILPQKPDNIQCATMCGSFYGKKHNAYNLS